MADKLDLAAMELAVCLNKVNNAYFEQTADAKVTVFYLGKFEFNNIQACRCSCLEFDWQRPEFEQNKCQIREISFDYLLELANRVMIDNFRRNRPVRIPKVW